MQSRAQQNFAERSVSTRRDKKTLEKGEQSGVFRCCHGVKGGESCLCGTSWGSFFSLGTLLLESCWGDRQR
jgi:hypothetical protein